VCVGLPYAVSQAGFFTGVFLLVALCAVTDWTIRLIVINAKMSGRSSYMDIMSHCFGWSGRAAVSLFQFSFAFGGMSRYTLQSETALTRHFTGMAAFCVIIGEPAESRCDNSTNSKSFQATQYLTSYDPYFLASRPLRLDFLSLVNLLLLSARLAYHILYPYTGTFPN
jgi:hypothetical protein